MITNSFKENINYILYRSPLVGTRFTLALAEFIWAITLLWQGDTFQRPTYSGMAGIMSETMWGLTFLITAIVQAYLLISMRFHNSFAVVFTGYNAFLWMFVCISMYMSVYPPPSAISGELALAFAASWVFMRSGFYCNDREKR